MVEFRNRLDLQPASSPRGVHRLVRYNSPAKSTNEEAPDTFIQGKTAHDPTPFTARDDEEEGSPSRDGANYFTSPSPFRRGPE